MAASLFDGTSYYKIKIDYNDFPIKLEKRFFEKAGKMINEISFFSKDLFYDILTCGIPHFFNCNRYTEIQYKIYLMKTALEIDDNKYIIASDKLKYLDSTERTFISYYVGMVMTKLVSREIFKFKYLVHLGIISKYTKIVRDKKEPDLVGFTKMKNGYTLFEAKGRKISPRKTMINAAKNQIKSIKSIGGRAPDMGVVCVTHPMIEEKRLTCSMIDPTPNESFTIDIDECKLIYLYYLPVYELIREVGFNEPQCNISFDKNINDKIEYNVKMSKKLFDFFNNYPTFNELNDKCFLELTEILSDSSNESKYNLLYKDNLLTIE